MLSKKKINEKLLNICSQPCVINVFLYSINLIAKLFSLKIKHNKNETTLTCL